MSTPSNASPRTTSGPPVAVWSGKILSRNGLPIEGAVVNIRGFRNLRPGQRLDLREETLQVVVGADGVLEFEMKPGWVYEIEAKAKGYGVEKYVVQDPTGQDLVLDKASDLTGASRQGDRASASGARVVFENGFETYEIRTDSDGRFRFEGIGARSAQVFVSTMLTWPSDNRSTSSVPAKRPSSTCS